MESVPFETFKHYKIFRSWLEHYKIPVIPTRYLPKHGLMVYYRGVPICCAFAYMTDSAVCLLDHFIKNPDVKDYNLTNQALDKVVVDIIKVAQSYRKEMALGIISNKRMIERARKHRFKEWHEKMTYFTRLI